MGSVVVVEVVEDDRWARLLQLNGILPGILLGREAEPAAQHPEFATFRHVLGHFLHLVVRVIPGHVE